MTDLACQYQSALKKCEEAIRDRDDHINMMKSPDMVEKKQEMEEKKRQLDMIEKQIGMFVDLEV